MKAVLLVSLALTAFAANSVLTRLALVETAIDPISFTAVRLASGALVLALIVGIRSSTPAGQGSLASALALFAYALCFSLAYVFLTAATGALLLFGAVQISMIAWSLIRGERLAGSAWLGFALALAGLVWLLLPGLARPPLMPALLMVAAGVAWAIYTLRARGAGDPTRATAGNFLIAALPAIGLALCRWSWAEWDGAGLALAMASGALASGLGYVVWYAALGYIRTSTAAVAQLLVPVLTAVAGVILLAEPLGLRLIGAGAIILGGILLVIAPWRRRPS
ncbi:DMT family transporter [Wenzhouxiangella marina]|uniref:EamA domain-containing protein n=1 Tax=Wenzhouxiangella marina TaxID=1579979 RepID=A0A0K0XUU8_9GAMM|nr:DMT family transporter [Wenzhouxiangella marina]AKS41397.1 hypothetical protein WM2015_1020 [Wenzhouxiangella marina]MBB6086849.1 drug/metabolite transporter (DMT)-like permease [Wenzhouxiangella marina]